MISRNYITDSDLRKRQIDTLKIFNHNVLEIMPNEEYSVGFMLNDREIKINVYLGINFPNEHPRLVVNPILNHHWVDNFTGEIRNAPGLINFTIHSDLGRVVQVIIREFERFPPPILNEQKSSIQRSHDPVNIPIEPTIPQLQNLSLEELKQLASDPEYLDDFIEEFDFVKNLNNELDNLMIQVEKLANENVTKEEKLCNLKTRLAGTLNDFRELGQKYDKLNHLYKQKTEEYSPQHIRELLQISVSTADTICEEHIEHFLNGKLDVQAFVSNYMESKKLSAMRKAKEDRLSAQLNALERATY